MKDIKLKFGIKQFFNQNETKDIAMLGNILLLIGGAGIAVAGFPATLLTATGIIITLPAKVALGAHIAIAIGGFGKMITKMFGTVDENGDPVHTVLPSVKAGEAKTN